MQLYAHDENGQPILSIHATKDKRYFCTSCGTSVKLRKGPLRRAHFYHTLPQRKCKQAGKSLTHLQAQLTIQKILSHEKAEIEKRFPSISRVADVVWEEKKIVLEVQCSPMSVEEAQKRISDYDSLGYKVVWILHDKKFNKKKLAPVEIFLQNQLLFYTNIDVKGRGVIYDQYRAHYFFGPRSIVNLCKMYFVSSQTLLPAFIKKRLLQILFQGDLQDRCLKDENFLHRMLVLEEMQRVNAKGKFCKAVKRAIFTSYQAGLRVLLERVSG